MQSLVCWNPLDLAIKEIKENNLLNMYNTIRNRAWANALSLSPLLLTFQPTVACGGCNLPHQGPRITSGMCKDAGNLFPSSLTADKPNIFLRFSVQILLETISISSVLFRSVQ